MSDPVRAGIVCVLTAVLAVSTYGDEPAKPKVTVDFRWIEPQVVKGLTEDQGRPIVCDGPDWFVRRKPVLTSKDIAAAKLTHLNLAGADQYLVEFTLTKGATEKLSEACGDEPGRTLTVYVNGHWYGSSYFDKAKPKEFSPPMAGFLLSKTHAEEILEASRREAAGTSSKGTP